MCSHGVAVGELCRKCTPLRDDAPFEHARARAARATVDETPTTARMRRRAPRDTALVEAEHGTALVVTSATVEHVVRSQLEDKLRPFADELDEVGYDARRALSLAGWAIGGAAIAVALAVIVAALAWLP